MLTFIYSTVNAGKTANLLMRAYSCCERNISHSIYVPDVASARDGKNQIASRIGFTKQAISVSEEDNLLEITVKKLINGGKDDVIFVDEAQFLTKEQVIQLSNIVSELEIKVYAYGLRTDFRGEPFEGSVYLMSWADEIQEISTFGSNGSKAIFNQKIDKNGNGVSEGDSVDAGFHYIPVTRSEFVLLNRATDVKGELDIE
jgi:thymidine kinase